MTLDGRKIIGSATFTPDPSIVHAVGRSHSFPSAVADIIDNSVDAGATQVRVRFLRREGVVIGLRVIDNGKGMDGETFEQAMQYAKQRSYADGKDLGHFGIGMKAASMSQADQLTVYSRMYGATPAGRLIERQDPNRVYALDADDVTRQLDEANAGFSLESGTIVEWAEPRTFLVDAEADHREQWFSTTTRHLTTYLGAHFHRLLARDAMTITVDEWDLGLNDGGIPLRVVPLDPFSFLDNGTGYFGELVFSVDGLFHTGTAVIWPVEQALQPGYILTGGGIRNQGFFVYRNDRLLSMGGWHGLAHETDQLAFARIALDIDVDLERHVTFNPEKAGVEFDATLREALKHCEIGSQRLALQEFLDKAKGVYTESRKYAKHPTQVAQPDRGFSSSVKIALETAITEIGDTATFAPGGPVNIRWRPSSSDDLIEIDHDTRTIWLNSKYRAAISGNNDIDNNDVPLIKALLLILYHEHFDGAYFGSKEKRAHAVWQRFLLAALDEQVRSYEARQQREAP
jgi:hypothetical protein